MSADCIFCRIIAGELPAQMVARTDHWVAFPDIAPKTPVHVLVVPTAHVEGMHEVDLLSAEARAEMPGFIADVARRTGVEGSGYRVTSNTGPDARQEVTHLHWHVMGGTLMSSTM